MSWAIAEHTIDNNFVLSEEDGDRRLAFIDRVAAEDAFPKLGGHGRANLERLLQLNAGTIGRIAAAKFAAGGGFRPQPDSRLRVTLSATS
jgi:hypothetical protein